MNRIQSLKRVLKGLREGREVREEAGLAVGEGKEAAIFRLAVAVHNSSLTANASAIQDNNNRTIILLEQLTLAIAHLTSFNPIPKSLALFKKYQFYQQCEGNKEFAPLSNKVFGLFPRTSTAGRVPKLLSFDSVLCQQQTVGNPNWLLSRSILIKWMRKYQQDFKKDVELSIYILLSMEGLCDLVEGVWEKLWAYLYLWLNRAFLQPYQGNSMPSWCTYDNQKFISLIESLQSDKLSAQNQVILNLVIFIIKQYICKIASEDNDYFSRASSAFFQIVPSSDPWLHLLTVEILKPLSSKLGHDNLAARFESIISDAKASSKSSSLSEEMKFLLPHMMRREEVVEYIVSHQLNFWEYGLEEGVNQRIALSYLQDIHKFKEEEDRFKILENLGIDSFKRMVLDPKLGRKAEKAVVKTILAYAESFAGQLHKEMGIEQGQCRADLLLFASQWDSYYSIMQQGIFPENYAQCIEFLSFDLSALTSAFKSQARLPQQSPSHYHQILQLFTTYSLQNNIPPYPLFLDSNFPGHLLSLSPSALQTHWCEWSSFLLSQQSMASLMKISPA